MLKSKYLRGLRTFLTRTDVFFSTTSTAELLTLKAVYLSTRLAVFGRMNHFIG